jgi:hypothetical protein
MAGADLQKSPVLSIGALTQVPTRPLGTSIGMTFQLASFGKPPGTGIGMTFQFASFGKQPGTGIGMTFQLASFGKHIAKVFAGTRLLAVI